MRNIRQTVPGLLAVLLTLLVVADRTLAQTVRPETLRREAELHQKRATALGVDAELGLAEQQIRRALRETIRRTGRTDHPDVARDLRFLADLHRIQGRLEEAEALLRWSIDMLERLQGPWDPDLATNLLLLGDLCADQQRYNEAEPLYLQAITIRTQLWGDAHPAVAEGLDHLSVLLRKVGRVSEAERADLRAQTIRTNLLTALGDASLIVEP